MVISHAAVENSHRRNSQVIFRIWLPKNALQHINEGLSERKEIEGKRFSRGSDYYSSCNKDADNDVCWS